MPASTGKILLTNLIQAISAKFPPHITWPVHLLSWHLTKARDTPYAYSLLKSLRALENSNLDDNDLVAEIIDIIVESKHPRNINPIDSTSVLDKIIRQVLCDHFVSAQDKEEISAILADNDSGVRLQKTLSDIGPTDKAISYAATEAFYKHGDWHDLAALVRLEYSLKNSPQDIEMAYPEQITLAYKLR